MLLNVFVSPYLGQLIHSFIDAAGCDARRIEWLTQMHHCAVCLHHRIAFVVFDEFGQRVKGFTTANVVFFVLQRRKKESVS